MDKIEMLSKKDMYNKDSDDYEMSMGEMIAVQEEWEKYKIDNEIIGFADTDIAWDFILTECKGVYDTEVEQRAIFTYIGLLEETE